MCLNKFDSLNQVSCGQTKHSKEMNVPATQTRGSECLHASRAQANYPCTGMLLVMWAGTDFEAISSLGAEVPHILAWRGNGFGEFELEQLWTLFSWLVWGLGLWRRGSDGKKNTIGGFGSYWWGVGDGFLGKPITSKSNSITSLSSSIKETRPTPAILSSTSGCGEATVVDCGNEAGWGGSIEWEISARPGELRPDYVTAQKHTISMEWQKRSWEVTLTIFGEVK